MSGWVQSSSVTLGIAPTSPQAIGPESEILRQILNPEVNLSLWQRPHHVEISQELSTLMTSDSLEIRCSTSLESFDNDLNEMLTQQGFNPSKFPNWRTDLQKLADCYFGVSGQHEFTLRLETTNKDGCRRFHVDRTRLRLLCTYHGPGTEWLANEQVDRSALNSGGLNNDMIRFGEPSQFAPFWVGILKGKMYPGNSARGLVHRSPQIEGSGQTRLLFSLDS